MGIKENFLRHACRENSISRSFFSRLFGKTGLVFSVKFKEKKSQSWTLLLKQSEFLSFNIGYAEKDNFSLRYLSQGNTSAKVKDCGCCPGIHWSTASPENQTDAKAMHLRDNRVNESRALELLSWMADGQGWDVKFLLALLRTWGITFCWPGKEKRQKRQPKRSTKGPSP